MKKTSHVLIAAGAALLMSLPTVAQPRIADDGVAKAMNRQVNNSMTSLKHASKQGFTLLRNGGDSQVRTLFTPLTAAPRRTTDQTFTPDWKVTFDSKESFDLFSVIDNNGDGQPNASYISYGMWGYYRSWGSVPSYALYYKKYGSDIDADDYLVSPGLQLRGGRSYKLTFEAAIGSFDDKGTLEVRWGRSATVDGMDMTLFAPTDIQTHENQTPNCEEHTVEFRVEEDGIYYLGFHVMTKYEQGVVANKMYLNNVAVEALPDAKTPGAVTDVTVTPSADASMKATIKFCLPTVAFDGSELEQISGVRIINGTTEVADIAEGIAPGNTIQFTDENVGSAAGSYTYSIVPYNDLGDGRATAVSAWVGLDMPGQCELVELIDKATHITMRWTVPQAVHGGVLFADSISYDIWSAMYNSYYDSWTNDTLVATVKGTTTHDFDIDTEEGPQREMTLGINAYTSSGNNRDFRPSNTLFIGKSYALPYREGFREGQPASYISGAVFGNGGMDAQVGTAIGSDADGNSGYVVMRGYSNDLVILQTGKVTLQGAASPKLVYQYYPEQVEQGKLMAVVMTPDGRETIVDSVVFAETPQQKEWTVRKVDLTDYAAERYVRLAFAFQSPLENTMQTLWLDDINVAEVPQVDLGVSLTAAEQVEKGQQAWMYAMVTNLGDADVDAFRLKATLDGELIADTLITDRLASFRHASYRFTAPTSLLLEKNEVEACVEVVAEGDAVADNNTSADVIALHDPDVKPATDLARDEQAAGMTLTWTEPVPTKTITDDFERYTPWSFENVGDWTFYDGDGGTTGGYLDSNDYYYTNEGKPFAFIVFNPYDYDGTDMSTYLGYYYFGSVVPEHGEQSLTSVWSYDGMSDTATDYYGNPLPNYISADNWVISPELSGLPQTISYLVNNVGYRYGGDLYDIPETYEVYYSATDTAIESFQRIGEQRTVTGGMWHEESFDVPEGARYFAIRHNTELTETDGGDTAPSFFGLDDITYEIMSGVVAGFRIYRDGELIATTREPRFTDDAATMGQHLYQVTVVYEDGTESAAVSLLVNVDEQTVGILTIPSGRQGADDVVSYDLQGRRMTSAQQKQAIRIADGKKMLPAK
ncbi:MAG: choice-of-anchor J domain-containing protein [Prevotella sp.]|nr:choice-of-anchor J domain-containing protein [Prevotella sp.]